MESVRAMPQPRSLCLGKSAWHPGYIGIMEKKMETTIVYWGYIGDILG